jgi:hypothetical protein
MKHQRRAAAKKGNDVVIPRTDGFVPSRVRARSRVLVSAFVTRKKAVFCSARAACGLVPAANGLVPAGATDAHSGGT